ncbi:hypothetical protein KY289_027732 [Solanum tuberosum]|nr:hypothetical protein KY289_027732 [Solanum tuberosum]
MTSDKMLFKELRNAETKKVRIGNCECLAVKCKSAKAITSGSRTKFITNILYVPDLDQNLLSVGQLMESGLNLYFKNKFSVIEDPSGDEIFKVEEKGSYFPLNLLEEEQAAFLMSDKSTEVWHKRMDHFHHQCMTFLQRNELVNDLPRL